MVNYRVRRKRDDGRTTVKDGKSFTFVKDHSGSRYRLILPFNIFIFTLTSQKDRFLLRTKHQRLGSQRKE